MKSAIILVLALVSQVSMAAPVTISCPDIGELYPDGDQLFVAYNEKLGFSDRTDTAYLVNSSQNSADYRVSKWGALLVIPKVLLSAQGAGLIQIFLPETAWQAVPCTSK